MNLTKGEIDRLGSKIRENVVDIPDAVITELQNYRTSHKDALSNTFTTLCACTKKISPTSIVTFRIKRFQSIIGKLERYPEMRFSRMWDIGGCRCILKDENSVYKLKSIIENDKSLEVIKEYDYIKEPQVDGYKSVHLFVKHTCSDKVIEVQLRSLENHNWATLVEISDLLFDSKLKEYGQDKKLLEFHKLLSNPDNLSIKDKYQISKVIKEYRYFERLSEVFSRNYLKVRKQWAEKETKSNHKFLLIEANKDDVPRIDSFYSFQEAEENYFNIYKTRQNANVVLTHLQNINYSQISIAYSNYILTFHSFLFECLEILESLIVDTLKTKKHISFYRVCHLYNSLLFTHISNLVSEINEVHDSKILQESSMKNKSKNKRKEIEWFQDIQQQVKKLNLGGQRFQISIRQNIKSGSFLTKNINSIIVRLINRTYRKKIESVMSTSKYIHKQK
jgi:putative GTP pyrophosphokinase